VLDFGVHRWAFEMKLTSAPAPLDLERLDHAAGLIGAERRFLVSQISASTHTASRFSGNIPDLLPLLASAP
jgi:hypothetical protein